MLRWVCEGCGTSTTWPMDVEYIGIGPDGKPQIQREKSGKRPYQVVRMVTHLGAKVGLVHQKLIEFMTELTGTWPVDPNGQAQRMQEVCALVTSSDVDYHLTSTCACWCAT